MFVVPSREESSQVIHPVEFYRPPLRAPSFPDSPWLNLYDPTSQNIFHDQVLLLNFFEFTCINCLRSLPYLRAWHARYESLGFKLFGIHTPEFKFAHDPEVVKTGLARLGIHWPVMLDNDQSLWTAYANRYWPSLYLIDHTGKIRYRHAGEGNYRAIEAKIQELLRACEPEASIPKLLAPIAPEDAESAFCAPTSPEIQLGSIDQIELDLLEPKIFQLPEQREPDRIYLDGSWRITQDGITLVSNQGEIGLRYQAAKVHVVLAPNPDDRERLLFGDEPLYIQVLQDGDPLKRSCFGDDILAEGTNARFRVEFPRLYSLVENPGVESHELRLKINLPGLTFYAFSFGSCVAKESAP